MTKRTRRSAEMSWVQVRVALDETRDEGGAGEIDDLGARGDAHLGGGTDGDDALPADEHDESFLGLRGDPVEDARGAQEVRGGSLGGCHGRNDAEEHNQEGEQRAHVRGRR
jgi:hypothetical protein